MQRWIENKITRAASILIRFLYGILHTYWSLMILTIIVTNYYCPATTENQLPDPSPLDHHPDLECLPEQSAEQIFIVILVYHSWLRLNRKSMIRPQMVINFFQSTKSFHLCHIIDNSYTVCILAVLDNSMFLFILF